MKKNPLKSKTIWGVAALAIAPYAPVLLAQVGIDNAPDVIKAGATLFGAGLAVYGRYKAK